MARLRHVHGLRYGVHIRRSMDDVHPGDCNMPPGFQGSIPGPVSEKGRFRFVQNVFFIGGVFRGVAVPADERRLRIEFVCNSLYRVHTRLHDGAHDHIVQMVRHGSNRSTSLARGCEHGHYERIHRIHWSAYVSIS